MRIMQTRVHIVERPPGWLKIKTLSVSSQYSIYAMQSVTNLNNKFMETIKFKTFLHGRFVIVEVNPWNQAVWHITTVNHEDSETSCGWQHCELTKVSCSATTTRWTFKNSENLRFLFKKTFEDFLERNIFFEEIPYEEI